MGATPEGKAWCIKALHPSDPITTVRGIPDERSTPTVVLSYYNVYRIPAPSGVTSWGFDLTVTPNVISQGGALVYDQAGLLVGTAVFLNSNLTPPGVTNPTYNQLRQQWVAMGIEEHRLIGMGVTAYQDGPALSDQGTLTCAQWAVSHRKYSFSAGGAGVCATNLFANQVEDLASYDSSQHMPNAYFGESKNGCYMPLRLSTDAFEWKNDSKIMFYTGLGTGPTVTLPVTGTAPTPQAPYLACTPAYVNLSGALLGDQIYKSLNSVWGGISCRNLSPATSFAFYVRMAVECRVSPNSLMAPQQTMAPAYDPVALGSYFRISRELKDGYPADYNDLGKLWETIKGVARSVSSVLSVVPGPVGAIAGGVNALLGPKPPTAPANPPPAAAVQRAKDTALAPIVVRGQVSKTTKKAKPKKVGKKKH